MNPPVWDTDYATSEVAVGLARSHTFGTLITRAITCEGRQDSVHFSQCILDRFTGLDPSLTDCILEPAAKWPTADVISWKKTLVEPAADTRYYNCLAWVDRRNNVLKKIHDDASKHWMTVRGVLFDGSKPMNSWTRIGLALVLGFFIAAFISLVNGRDVVSALLAGVGFAVLVGVIVATLSWGMDRAVEKGYPSWFGFFLALCLNVVGLIILALLPAYTPRSKPPVAR
jgi:hypothetical protein